MKSIFALAGLASIFASTALAANCPETATDAGTAADGKTICAISGTFKQNMTLTSDKVWMLKGGVFIGGDNTESAVLRIEAGTKITGFTGRDFLVINRGSKIYAEGTLTKPIVFTAGKDSGRTRGLWGGLIINGNAPINSCSPNPGVCQAEGEGSTGLYGGSDPHDDSGVLRFVRIEWAGFQITPENEFNGLSLQGVGDRTVIDYVQLHMNADDGIEMFGGTVNMKHIVLTGNGDDQLDWTSGWNGRVQYVLVKQAGDDGNHGIEADNLEKFHNAEPRSMPTLSNVTLIGNAQGTLPGGNGIMLRRGSGAHFYNTIITGFKAACLNLDDVATYEQATAKNVTFSSTILHCPSSGSFAAQAATEPWALDTWFTQMEGNILADPMLNGNSPLAGSPALGNGLPPEDSFFEQTDFIGAMADANHDWTRFWSTDARD